MTTSAPWTLKDNCKCGHHHDTHYEGVYACTGMYCECKHFRKETDPDDRRRVDEKCPDTPRNFGASKPHADTTCTCPACDAWTRHKWQGWV